MLYSFKKFDSADPIEKSYFRSNNFLTLSDPRAPLFCWTLHNHNSWAD